MAKGWDYRSGDWNLICDVCSKKVKASTTKERWDGFRVCPSCFETRQPLDFIRVRQDKISVEFTRSQQTDTFVPINWTSYPNETITIDEVVSKDVGKTVPNDFIVTSSFIDESLGTQYLAAAPLGGSGTSGGYTNELYLSETVTVSLGRTVSPSDTLTISESVSITHIYNQSLGSQALAVITLG